MTIRTDERGDLGEICRDCRLSCRVDAGPVEIRHVERLEEVGIVLQQPRGLTPRLRDSLRDSLVRDACCKVLRWKRLLNGLRQRGGVRFGCDSIGDRRWVLADQLEPLRLIPCHQIGHIPLSPVSRAAATSSTALP